ncbi:MAG: DUF1573 domain-containing protein [Bacteroidetes bacterium]|nr:DUF1573 domain-containing protein [Bacteroidota bacterium]MCL2301733.1 DUF1573 domain-containing protein [Lentimicrobiaceae bacterium]
MKKQLFCFVMFLSTLALFAQPVIQFDNTTVDFGNIKESDGKASRKFEFTNTGDQDLLITSVKPGCGCTATDYTKTPVAPGQRGFITAAYDPHNRPGNFNKSIKVTTNEPKFDEGANGTPYSIFIKGTVEKKPPSKYETAGYKNGSGEIRIKDNNVKLDLLNTENKSFVIQVMNFSEKESTFTPMKLPAYITVENQTLKPNEEIEVTFKYDAAKKGEVGVYRETITIQTQDPVEPNITLFVDVTIREDFSKLTPKQLQDAPKAHLDELTVNFGKVEKNTNPTLQVKLHNNGKNTLHIRQLKASNTIFAVVSDKNEIPKGDFATLTVTLNSRNRRGKQNATIDIITNDPANSQFVLNCTGEISQ